MNTLQYIVDNGFNAESMSIIVKETGVERNFTCHPVIKSQFENCSDLELLKKFSLIMDDQIHIVDVESRMVELMGEDEYYDFIDG